MWHGDKNVDGMGNNAKDDPACECLMQLELAFCLREYWVDLTVKQGYDK